MGNLRIGKVDLFIEKYLPVSGLAQFKLVLFKHQFFSIEFNYLVKSQIFAQGTPDCAKGIFFKKE